MLWSSSLPNASGSYKVRKMPGHARPKRIFLFSNEYRSGNFWLFLTRHFGFAAGSSP